MDVGLRFKHHLKKVKLNFYALKWVPKIDRFIARVICRFSGVFLLSSLATLFHFGLMGFLSYKFGFV